MYPLLEHVEVRPVRIQDAATSQLAFSGEMLDHKEFAPTPTRCHPDNAVTGVVGVIPKDYMCSIPASKSRSFRDGLCQGLCQRTPRTKLQSRREGLCQGLVVGTSTEGVNGNSGRKDGIEEKIPDLLAGGAFRTPWRRR